ncbi:MAG: chemotaxis protein CheD [Thermodesulfovibrionales bacterium]|jgi:chemotaxis protein CheD|nr:chemotaxis protein CheD [Thermodesulfovibrionales bacterium]
MRKITLNIGDIVVCREPAVLETVLGSCVSVCLYDESLKAGGMNHFMVPYVMSGLKNPAYSGQESIKRLVEDFVSIGANSSYIKAKVFGGGKVTKGMGEDLDVGAENVKTAKEMLKKYGIPIVKELLCPEFAVKIVFYTATGRVFVKKLEDAKDDISQ